MLHNIVESEDCSLGLYPALRTGRLMDQQQNSVTAFSRPKIFTAKLTHQRRFEFFKAPALCYFNLNGNAGIGRFRPKPHVGFFFVGKPNDLDALMREAGDLKGLAAQLGQSDPNALEYEQSSPDAGRTAEA